MITVTSLYTYPIKSCGGINMNSTTVSSLGLQLDRRYVLIDEKGNFLSQRRIPKMCQIEINWGVDCLILNAPGATSHVLSFQPSYGVERTVNIWGGTGRGFDQGDDVAAWFTSFLGTPCRLLDHNKHHPRMRHSSVLNEDVPLRFADGYPVLVISEASLDDLNRRMAAPVPMNRFRPNVVVNGCEPYAEDAWGEISLGRVRLGGVKLCVRCSIPLVDQATGARGKEPLATLATYRKLPPAPGHSMDGVVFGKNFICLATGPIAVGELVNVWGATG